MPNDVKFKDFPEFLYEDATVLASWIRQRQISCSELMEVTISHIEAINPKINALIEMIDTEKMLEMADQADKQLSKKQSVGPLHGIPFALKEMLQVKGWKTSYCWDAGVSIPELEKLGYLQIHQQDGLLAGRLRAAGALFIGKTNMPEFAMGSHTKNKLFGPTLNPYHLQKSPGGSSGGAAAALASGIVCLADGSDLGGSLRIPAAFCNVVGFRPSIGRIPNPGPINRGRMNTEGPMARSVEDLALFMMIAAGPHKGDPLSRPDSSNIFSKSLETNIKELKGAFTPDFNHLPVACEVRKSLDSSAKVFEKMGFCIEEDYPDLLYSDPSKDILDAMSVFRILRVENIKDIAQLLWSGIGEIGIRKYCPPVVQYQLIESNQAITDMDIKLALDNQQRIRQLMRNFFEKYDFLICPAASALPFDIELDYIREIAGHAMSDYLEWMSICCILSVTGCPIVSMPAGFSPSGLPTGIQIICQPGEDFQALQIAYAFEQATKYSAKYFSPDISWSIRDQ